MQHKRNIFVITAALAGLIPTAAMAQDCNNNGVPDDIDLAGKMYWVDLDTDKIQRADLDGSNVEDLMTTGLGSPNGIALALPAPDTDADGVMDECDNCPDASNQDQADNDLDGFGDVCDNCPDRTNVNQNDADNNGIGDICEAPAPPPAGPCGAGVGLASLLSLVGLTAVTRIRKKT